MYPIPKGLLAKLRAELGKGISRFRNDFSDSIAELEEKMHDLTDRVTKLQAAIDGDGRSPTPEEAKERQALMDEFDETEKELQARLRLQDQEARLQASAGRYTVPGQPANSNADPESESEDSPAPKAQARPVQPAAPKASVEVGAPSYYKTGGFNHFGEFALAVFNANPRSGRGIDKRLLQITKNAPTDFGSEGVDADGGFAVPPDFRAEIMRKVMGEASIVGMTDQQTTTSKAMTFPMDETTPWQSTGGIQVGWIGEGQPITQSKPALTSGEIKLNKLAALVPITEELLEDAPAMDRYLNSKVPQNMGFALNDAIINGTGTGQPLGILQSGALITVAADTAQVADTITYTNIAKMRGAMYAAGKSRGVWLANPSIEETLMLMTFPSTTSTVPVYLPPNGASGSPYATLFGRPVIPTEACADTGDLGDLIFVDLAQYATLTRRGRGLRTDYSIHLFFDYDIGAFRFILRFGGRPWWNSPIQGKTASRKYSAFVALAERA
ncbi:phage major capsid protein [Desulfovibrio sp. OttesenSCG-928-A18]|nr:phage major capsid protein [Desulfovibrio sp. OttesenSCG-928-A18]